MHEADGKRSLAVKAAHPGTGRRQLMNPARVVRDADVRAVMHESERSVRCSVAAIDYLLQAASCIGGPP